MLDEAVFCFFSFPNGPAETPRVTEITAREERGIFTHAAQAYFSQSDRYRLAALWGDVVPARAFTQEERGLPPPLLFT